MPRTTRLVIVWGLIFSTLTLLLSILDVRSDLAQLYPVLIPVLKWLKFGFIVLLLALIITGMALAFTFSYELWVTRESKLSGLATEPCSETDLPEVYQLANISLSGIQSHEETRALYRHNTKCIRKVMDMKRNKEIVGYFAVLPLTKAGVEKIENKTFSVQHDGLSIFARRMPSRNAYYIGAAVATDRRSKAKCVKAIREFCESKHVATLYSRPTTDLGLRALRNNKFKPVHDEDKAEVGVMFKRSIG